MAWMAWDGSNIKKYRQKSVPDTLYLACHCRSYYQQTAFPRSDMIGGDTESGASDLQTMVHYVRIR